MEVTFLRASVALVKRFQQVGSEIEASPYPLVGRFTSIREQIHNLATFHSTLQQHATQGDCLLKGFLRRDLVNESRAKATSPADPTRWVLIDVDGLQDVTVEDLMQQIDLGDVSYIVQYSASMGVRPNKGLSCHIFVLLDREVDPALLKEWLIRLNMTYFKEHIQLNRLNESLHWPLDITTCQNDKLIYIAPPVCVPKTLDTYAGPRIVLVQKAKASYSFPQFTPVPTHEIEKLKNELRHQKGLTKSPKLKLDKTSQLIYSPNPQAAQVTGLKVGDEFTHLNLNGGDSWGYYHPTKHPEIIYNFKGEPNYKTSELLPEYWNQLQKTKQQERTTHLTSDTTVFAIRDRATSTYYTGYYNASSKTLTQFYSCTKREHVEDFLANNGVPIPDSIPDWSCEYDPDSHTTVNLESMKINWFQPSQFMQPPDYISLNPKSNFPESIRKLISNVIGNDPGLINHFVNWVACVFRYRRPTGTAWIFQGVPGTGKGMLINQVLIPLLGKTNVAVKRMRELEDKFNEHLENTLLCFIDEVSIGENVEHDKVLADLKQFITEPTITIRRMRQAAYEANNYTNWIFSTNNKQPVNIEQGDRRYSVGEFMRVPLRDVVGNPFDFVEQINKDLPEFANYLLSLTANRDQAATVFDNEARRTIMANSLSTIDVLAKALHEGDLEKLYEYVGDENVIADPVRIVLVKKYKEFMNELVHTLRDYLTRDELALICDCIIGSSTPKGAAKFTQYLRHHDIKIGVIWAGTKSMRGIKVDWRCNPEWLASIRAELASANVVPLRVAK